jgi:hypothetical protein
MKTLLSLCIGLLLTGALKAQQINPVPPTSSTWSDIRAAQLVSRLRQTPPMPAGGFWVVEDKVGQKGPTIVRYYTDQRQELRADTLAHKRLNIREKLVVFWLNEQLSQALAMEAKPALVSHQ